MSLATPKTTARAMKRTTPTPVSATMQLQMPLIHLNGTSPAELLKHNDRARLLISELISHLERHCHPNGRDYYPLGEQALKQATIENNDRIGKLIRIREELEQIGEYLADELDKRKR